MINPSRLLYNPIAEKVLNNGISTQCTGTIIPIIKYVIISFANFHRILAMAKAAIDPIIMLRIRVTTQTMAEFRVAFPKRPAVHAKV